MSNKLDHWVAELPEFGTPFSIRRLIDEQESIEGQIQALNRRRLEIDKEIEGMVTRQWSMSDIKEAKDRYLGLAGN